MLGKENQKEKEEVDMLEMFNNGQFEKLKEVQRKNEK